MQRCIYGAYRIQSFRFRIAVVLFQGQRRCKLVSLQPCKRAALLCAGCAQCSFLLAVDALRGDAAARRKVADWLSYRSGGRGPSPISLSKPPRAAKAAKAAEVVFTVQSSNST